MQINHKMLFLGEQYSMEYRILYFSGDSRGVIAGPVREGGSAVASVRGLESQEGACESLKGPVALAIDILF